MKPLSSLIDYYYTSLHKELKNLEKKRQNAKRSTLLSFGVVFILFSFVFLLFVKKHGSFETDWFLLYGTALVVAYGLVYKYHAKDYTKEFKLKIIAPLVAYMDENLHYSPYGYIPQSRFEQAKITTQTISSYRGDDLISGVVKGVRVSFCDLLVEKKEQNRNTNETKTLFEGVFLEAEFPKHFYGTTYVYPQSFGSFLHYDIFGSEKLLKLDNVEFERYFMVYGSDTIEARYLLSHSLMAKIVAFRKKVGYDMTFSFVGGKFFMAIHYDKPTFEAKLFSSLLDYKVAKEYMETLYFGISVVEELALNKKLWSKR